MRVFLVCIKIGTNGSYYLAKIQQIIQTQTNYRVFLYNRSDLITKKTTGDSIATCCFAYLIIRQGWGTPQPWML